MTITRMANPKQRWSDRDRKREQELLSEFSVLPVSDPRRAVIRDELVTMHLPLAEHLARRFQNRGEPYADLVQVATIGLIKAVDGFDPERGLQFSTYATPTIVGELKRHFRDRGTAIRIPRRLQELRHRTSLATDQLAQELGRSPTVRELARHMGVDEDDVLEGLESANAYWPAPLDGPLGGDSADDPLAETIGDVDGAFEHVDDHESLRPLLQQLPDRDRQVLRKRFVENMTQSEIASALGVSQMQISRILARSLQFLRAGLLQD